MKISESRHHSSKPKNPTFPELAQNNVRFFSSARHNYIVRNITKQRKTKKNQRWEFKLAFKFEKIAKKKPFLPVCNDIPAFLYLYLYLYLRLYFCILDCISVIVFLVFFFVFLSFCHFALCSSSSAAGWPGSGYSQTGPVVKLKQSSLRFQMNGSDAALVEIQTLSGY